ncbi:CCR4-NOT complex subunit CAF16 [Klebsormidium nitens]|uniref:CCR4-NOT complex subunit CAF16 n=1 Tax=Klebsormidium nitens TaxID=105231 RepID=A0A0U9HK72_KLENI|nr:CCR4-NOT complex subunit CAF16 [Klebsormidium nitens]|eukprot:GAQ85986.1 CCR4-NOT complex subunit CAF16 [Klebsormidium nitens]
MGEGAAGADAQAVSVNSLTFEYPGQGWALADLSLQLRAGSRCLLIGANGAGKTTLLRILAGRHMVGGEDVVRILGRPAFHDLQLVCGGDLAYLGGSWTRSAGSAGDIPLQGDFSAEHMLFGVADVDPARRAALIELLDIDLSWRMHKVSDGQRRRVQIAMGLLRPFKVLLLDEVTVDLDVVARMDLLNFFVQECNQRGATIVYATHIFDGLEDWATHVAYVEEGRMRKSEEISSFSELSGGKATLFETVEDWLRKERAEKEQAGGKAKKAVPSPAKPQPASTSRFDRFGSSRHMAYYR